MKKIIFLLTISLLIISSCSKEELVIKKHFETSTVSTWSVLDSSYQIWYTDSFDSVSLWAKVWWKITSINKDVWDRVRAWELIATLDWAEARVWYWSSLDIISSLESLKNSTWKSYDKQIEATMQQIKQLEKSLELADIWINWASSWVSDTKNINQSQINTLKVQLSQAELWLESSQLNYENTKNLLNQKENDIFTNSKNALSSSSILWNNVIDFLDNIFWVTDANKNKNNSFEIYLWARNSWQKNETENLIKKFIIDFRELEKNNKNLESKEEIQQSLENTYALFNNDLKKLLSLSYKVFENSVSWVALPDSTLNEFKRNISEFQTQNEQIILSVSWNYMVWLKWSLDNISTIEKEKKSTLDMLKKQIENSKKQIDILRETIKLQEASWSWMITEVNTMLLQSEKQKELIYLQINETHAWIQAIENQKLAALSEIDAKISEVKAGKNEAWVMIDNTRIYSPIDWIIVQKFAEVWQVIWAWNPVFVVSDSSDIKIEISVWENLEELVFVWKKVQVEIDWVSQIKTWTITKILPQRDLVTKRVLLEIKLENNNGDIKLWSYSKVYFEFEDTNYGIIIPNNAIISRYMIPWVYVLQDNKAIFKKIEILKQNDSFSEVIWLEVWEIIITNWKENIFDWEKLK
jgi:membrane fusion protein (multidrug efflux system)